MKLEKKLVFIFNPKAGKGKIKTSLMDIVDIFNKGGYEVIIRATQAPKDAYEQVKKYADKVDLIVCSGGDGGKLAAQAPLPIGGILSDQPVSVLGKQLGQVRKAMEDLGYDNNNVIMSMSTLCLPVSPRLKLTDFGLLEVKSQEKVPLIQTYFDKNGMRI